MKKTLILCTLVAIVSFVTGLKVGQPNDLQVANYNTLSYKIELIQTFEEYYNSVETVLDETWDVYDTFGDTVAEGDAYCDYAEAKDRVDSLLNLKE